MYVVCAQSDEIALLIRDYSRLVCRVCLNDLEQIADL